MIPHPAPRAKPVSTRINLRDLFRNNKNPGRTPRGRINASQLSSGRCERNPMMKMPLVSASKNNGIAKQSLFRSCKVRCSRAIQASRAWRTIFHGHAGYHVSQETDRPVVKLQTSVLEYEA